MNSFIPGQLIHNKYAHRHPVVVIVVKPAIPPCGAGSAFITFLPLGDIKPLGPIFAVPSHWDALEETNR